MFKKNVKLICSELNKNIELFIDGFKEEF